MRVSAFQVGRRKAALASVSEGHEASAAPLVLGTWLSEVWHEFGSCIIYLSFVTNSEQDLLHQLEGNRDSDQGTEGNHERRKQQSFGLTPHGKHPKGRQNTITALLFTRR